MFKVGDKVQIKSDLKIDKPYNGCYFVSKMEVYKGKIGTITDVLDGESDRDRRYKLDINKAYYFSDDMLEPINDSNSILPYKIGDIVKIIDELPENLYGINTNTWKYLLGKSGKIIHTGIVEDSYLITIPEISASFWFPSKYFKKESTLTNKNSTENVSKLIECVPEIKLSYCKKQIYTI